MNGASPEVCESWVVACRRFLDDGRCPLGWRPNLLGHGGDGAGDRREVWADARLVCRWLQAPFWCGVVSAASPICSDFQTFCPDWLHFGHFLCFGGIAASQLSLRIFPIYF